MLLLDYISRVPSSDSHKTADAVMGTVAFGGLIVDAGTAGIVASLTSALYFAILIAKEVVAWVRLKRKL